ncbi:hypothetical protein KHP62_02850 [Rhodobacteraceae bacterium NNCM2]|nr:hypothetical protein [Coraliihabitans acroporae]
MRILVFSLVILATPALAQEAGQQIVSPDAFREYAEGYTLYFEQDGEPFGTESFEEGGATKWRYDDGSCVAGAWRPHGGQICFFYGDNQGVLCWRMTRREGVDGMIAKLLSDGENKGMELHITRRDKVPLLCGEPGTES